MYTAVSHGVFHTLKGNVSSCLCYQFFTMFFVSIGAERGSSARGMVASSNLKATEELFSCARFAGEKG